MTPAPALVLVAHGSRARAARAVLEAVRCQVAEARPEIPAVLAFLDHDEPRLRAALDSLRPGPAVVVPYLLAHAFHVRTDIQTDMAAEAKRTDRPIEVARVLGDHPALPALAAELLRDAAAPDGADVVLAATGTGDDEANEQTAVVGRTIADQLGRRVTTSFVSGPEPSLAATLARVSRPVTVLPWVLAPGRFADAITRQAAHSGAGCTAILGTRPELAALVWDRYDEAAEALSRRNES